MFYKYGDLTLNFRITPPTDMYKYVNNDDIIANKKNVKNMAPV